MKITYLYQYYGTPNGSWSTRVYELTKNWVKLGHDVTVITSPYEKSDISSNQFIKHIKINNVKIIIINSSDSNRFPIYKRVFNALLFSIISTFYTLKLKSDIVIASSGPITIAIPAIINKIIKSIPYIFEIRDLWPDGGIEMGLIKGKFKIRISKFFEKVCYYFCDRIVVSSLGQYNFLKDKNLLKEISIIPHPVDINFFNNLNDEKILKKVISYKSNKFVFIHIGSLGLIHNCSYIIKAAKKLDEIDVDKKIKICFLGDGVEKEKLIKMTEKYNLKNVDFLGLVPKTEIPYWLKICEASLFTTLNNPIQDTCSPNKLYDSFASRKPIIQTSSGWICDIVKENQLGYNVSINNPIEMAQKMLQIVTATEINKISENCYDYAKKQLDSEILSNKYLKILKRAL